MGRLQFEVAARRFGRTSVCLPVLSSWRSLGLNDLKTYIHTAYTCIQPIPIYLSLYLPIHLSIYLCIYAVLRAWKSIGCVFAGLIVLSTGPPTQLSTGTGPSDLMPLPLQTDPTALCAGGLTSTFKKCHAHLTAACSWLSCS